MSKITNDGLTLSGTGCFIAVPIIHMPTEGIKGLTHDPQGQINNQCCI